nr:hypothetical protein [Rhizobium sp. G21]
MTASRQLMQICLADNHGSCGAKVVDADGVVGSDMIAEQARTRRRRPALHVDDILDRNGNSMQRPARPAGSKLRFESICLFESLLAADEDHRVDPIVAGGDPLQAIFNDADRRQASVVALLYLGNRRRSVVCHCFRSICRSKRPSYAS